MRHLPASRGAGETLGPGTRPPLRAVPGQRRGRALRHRAAGAGGGNASDYARRSRLSGSRCRPGAAAAVPREALVGAAVSNSGRAADRPAHLCLDRGAAALSGARYPRSLGSRGGGRVPVTTAAVLSSDAVRQALRQVKDPELDMNIVDLGLVYDVEVDDGLVRINMTLTSPGCPAGPMITNDIYKVVRAMEGVKDVDIDIVWEPYWTPDRIDPKIRAMMGF